MARETQARPGSIGPGFHGLPLRTPQTPTSHGLTGFAAIKPIAKQPAAFRQGRALHGKIGRFRGRAGAPAAPVYTAGDF